MVVKTKQFVFVKNDFKSSNLQTTCFNDRHFPGLDYNTVISDFQIKITEFKCTESISKYI
jgi:hypothetical protein